MPKPPTTKPPPHRQAATTPAKRGPTSSIHLPVNAADKPKNRMATENTQTTSPMPQSSAALATTPSSFTRTGLKMLHE